MIGCLTYMLVLTPTVLNIGPFLVGLNFYLMNSSISLVVPLVGCTLLYLYTNSATKFTIINSLGGGDKQDVLLFVI